MKTLILTTLLLCAAILTSQAQERARNVRIKITHYQISLTELNKLLDNQNPLQDSLYQQVRRLQKDAKAKLINCNVISTMNQEQCLLQSGSEFIFPSDYNPPGSLQFNSPPNGAGGLGNIPFRIPLRPSGSTPTAFETQTLGELLQCVATIGKQTVDIDMATKDIQLHKHSIWYHHKDRWGNANITMPEFLYHNIQQNVSVKYGKTRYLTALSSFTKDGKTNPNQKILVFIHATLVSP
ncbi:MAG: hypothetical protein ACPG32_09620 [Akkermansiaceae bacterium]